MIKTTEIDVKTTIIKMLHMLKKLDENMTKKRRKWKIHKGNHSKPLDMKNVMSKIKNIQDIQSRLNTAE